MKRIILLVLILALGQLNAAQSSKKELTETLDLVTRLEADARHSLREITCKYATSPLLSKPYCADKLNEILQNVSVVSCLTIKHASTLNTTIRRILTSLNGTSETYEMNLAIRAFQTQVLNKSIEYLFGIFCTQVENYHSIRACLVSIETVAMCYQTVLRSDGPQLDKDLRNSIEQDLKGIRYEEVIEHTLSLQQIIGEGLKRTWSPFLALSSPLYNLSADVITSSYEEKLFPEFYTDSFRYYLMHKLVKSEDMSPLLDSLLQPWDFHDKRRWGHDICSAFIDETIGRFKNIYPELFDEFMIFEVYMSCLNRLPSEGDLMIMIGLPPSSADHPSLVCTPELRIRLKCFARALHLLQSGKNQARLHSASSRAQKENLERNIKSLAPPPPPCPKGILPSRSTYQAQPPHPRGWIWTLD